jgi:hypothetical protein
VKEIGVGVGVRAKAAYRLPTHLHVRRRAQADLDSIQSSVESGETGSKAGSILHTGISIPILT